MTMPNCHFRKQKGVSLIEVLVAILIFSLGLIGLAGLLVMATRANHGAYERTQVSYMAHNMADRMSANPIGVWNDAYNGDNYPLDSVTSNCATGCTPAELAVHDQQLWSAQLKTFLPNPKASIDCSSGAAGFSPTAEQIKKRLPYGGSCEMTITWSGRGVGGEENRDTQEQTFAWEFQP